MSIKKRVAVLERHLQVKGSCSKVFLGDVPEGTTVCKGRFIHSDPEICRNLPEPKSNLIMWNPQGETRMFNEGNFHFLPCYGCEYFGRRCQGPVTVEIDEALLEKAINGEKKNFQMEPER